MGSGYGQVGPCMWALSAFDRADSALRSRRLNDDRGSSSANTFTKVEMLLTVSLTRHVCRPLHRPLHDLAVWADCIPLLHLAMRKVAEMLSSHAQCFGTSKRQQEHHGHFVVLGNASDAHMR